MLLAKRRAAEQEILCCEKELAAYEARTELLPLSRDLNARRIALAEQEIKQWQETVNRRRQQEAEQQVRQAAWEAGQADPRRAPAGREQRRPGRDAKIVGPRIIDATRQLDEVKQELERSEGAIQAGPGKGRGGRKNEYHERHRPSLRKQRETLPNLRELSPQHRCPAADDGRRAVGTVAI